MDYNTIHNRYTKNPSSSSTPKLIPSYNNSRRPINARNDKNNSNNNNKGCNKNSSINKKVVKLSTDPQSVAARERRHRISDRFKILQSLVPGGDKLDTVSLLDHAIQYVKFLKAQIWLHEVIINNNNNEGSKGNYVQDYWYDQSLINVDNINNHSNDISSASVIQGEQYCYDALMCNSDINNVGEGQQEGGCASGCYGGYGGGSSCCNPNQEICMAVPKEEPVYDNWCYKGDDNQNVFQIRPCNYY